MGLILPTNSVRVGRHSWGSHLWPCCAVVAFRTPNLGESGRVSLGVFRQRFIQGTVATSASGMMLAAFVGLSAAARQQGLDTATATRTRATAISGPKPARGTPAAQLRPWLSRRPRSGN